VSYPYNKIFKLPERVLLHKRLPKNFFTKKFELSAAEKRLLNQVITQMEWMASIKPNNANIPMIKTNEWVYEEVQVMKCTVENNELEKQGIKCAELMQKYIPYPMVVIVEDEHEFIITACHKRVNQADTSKRTIENWFNTTPINKLYNNELSEKFFKALDFAAIDKTNLQTSYNSYTNAIVQYQVAETTGVYKTKNQQKTNTDLEYLHTIEDLEKEIIGLRNLLKKEQQINAQVNLNITIQEKKKEIERLKNILSTI
jgi:hypothetical protein